MSIPDWRKLTFSDGVLPEWIPDDNRIVLWLPRSRQERNQCWERIATVPGAEVSLDLGICAIAATSIRARRRGFLGNLWQHLRPESGAQGWILPNGAAAEQ